MNNDTVNEQQAALFGDRLLRMLNEGGLAYMLSIGHKTSLFDTMTLLPPATSSQIAEAAGLNERYVREWLNALTVGRILTYQPASKTYHLPAEHAQFLARTAGADNMAIYNAKHRLNGAGGATDR